jgi:S1-C subfamily serine protease
VTIPARWLSLLISGGVAVAILGACASPVRFATPEEVAAAKAPPPPQVITAPAAPPAPGGLTEIQADVRRLIAQIGPSVVRIDAGAASGSGLVLDSQGTVVAPASLVAGSQQVTVTTATGQQYAGTVAGSDPGSDIAVIRVTGASGLTAVTLADSGTVQVGDVVVAVGHQVAPSGTASYGIVSGLAGTMSSGSLTLTGLVQTTAPMAAGTSGSALVNIAGQVIGLTTLGASGSPGPGVAIPSDQVSSVSKTLLAGGTQAGTAYLGVVTADATGGGALIQSVASGSPAAGAGMQVGWVILAIDGKPVARAAAIAPILAGDKPGQRVVLTVHLPNGSTRSIPVVLGTH